MFDYIQIDPLLSGLINGSILWGIFYLILGLIFKDNIAKKIGFWVLVLGLILIIIA